MGGSSSRAPSLTSEPIKEQTFRDVVTTELVAQYSWIKQLIPLILDYALPVWTWSLHTDEAWDIAILNATRQTATIVNPIRGRDSSAWGKWIDLPTTRALHPSESLMFRFDNIPDASKPLTRLRVSVTGARYMDTLRIGLVDPKYVKAITIEHVRIPLERPHDVSTQTLGYHVGKRMTELSHIVLIRNEREVRIRIAFHTGNELDYRLAKSLTTSRGWRNATALPKANPDDILVPALGFWMYFDLSNNPVDWVVSLGNFIEKS